MCVYITYSVYLSLTPVAHPRTSGLRNIRCFLGHLARYWTLYDYKETTNGEIAIEKEIERVKS